MLKVIFLLLVSFISLFATDLDNKIELLKTAPKEQRYKIMNEIKQELVKLNESQREHLMQKLFIHKKGVDHQKLQSLNNFQQEHVYQEVLKDNTHNKKQGHNSR